MIETIDAATGTVKDLSTLNYQSHVPFAFDELYKNKPTYYEVLFVVDNLFYEYSFSVLQTGILTESLYRKNNINDKDEEKILLWKRGQQKITFGNVLKTDFKEIVNYLEKSYHGIIWSNTLILTLLSNLKVPLTVKIVEWFQNSLYIKDLDWMDGDICNPNHPGNFEWFSTLLDKESYKNKSEEILRDIDCQIKGINIKPTENQSGNKSLDIRTIHSYLNNPNKEHDNFPLMWESDGTKKIFSYLPDILFKLENGGLILIDELDSKLQPVVFNYIVSLFADKRINKSNAQLIFNAHNGTMLSNDYIRVDEIYFTEKNEEGKSELYTLGSFYENDERLKSAEGNWYMDYLFGRYGAVPDLRLFNKNL